jgi:hypothetical protein
MKIGTIAVLAFSLAGCASTPVAVPDKLRPAANESLAMVVPAKGEQIYECRAAKAGGLEWAFVAPEAELFDRGGKRIGRHYAGPHWEAADGSKVIASVKAREEAPSSRDIPWLLLSARSVGPQGAFSGVTSIQRVSTTGGIAPAAACAQAGTRARVPYTADYYFFISK